MARKDGDEPSIIAPRQGGGGFHGAGVVSERHRFFDLVLPSAHKKMERSMCYTGVCIHESGQYGDCCSKPKGEPCPMEKDRDTAEEEGHDEE